MAIRVVALDKLKGQRPREACHLEPSCDPCPIGDAVERQHMRIIAPCQGLARHAHVFVEMRTEQALAVCTDHILRAVVAKLMTGIHAKADVRRLSVSVSV